MVWDPLPIPLSLALSRSIDCRCFFLYTRLLSQSLNLFLFDFAFMLICSSNLHFFQSLIFWLFFEWITHVFLLSWGFLFLRNYSVGFLYDLVRSLPDWCLAVLNCCSISFWLVFCPQFSGVSSGISVLFWWRLDEKSSQKPFLFFLPEDFAFDFMGMGFWTWMKIEYGPCDFTLL